MDLIVRLASLGDLEVAELSVNRESIFDFAKFDAVRDALCLVLRSKSQRSAEEAQFLASWLQGFANASQFLQEIPEEIEEEHPTDAVSVRKFIVACERIRSVMKNPSELGTAYKILFLAALHSSRDLQVLSTMLHELRRSLAASAIFYFLISDGIARALPDFPYRPSLLSIADREIVIALACRMLNIDTAHHIDERSMFRLVMASIELPRITPQRLGALAKRDQIDLMRSLVDPGKQSVALLNLLRMMLADQVTKSTEEHIMTSAIQASTLDRSIVQRLERFVELESEKQATV